MNRLHDAAALILRNPLDPDFPVRWMTQFSDEYLTELVHVCRERVTDLHVEITALEQRQSRYRSKPRAKQIEELKAEKRRVIGRLSAVIRHLHDREIEVPKYRKPQLRLVGS